MSDKVTVYITSLSSSSETKKQQSRIQDVLSGMKIDFDLVDVSADRGNLDKMREIKKDSTALAPQLCRGDTYLGDYEAFELAVEDKIVSEFLKCPAQE